MPAPTPEELRTWREGAVAAGNTADVARIDAELAKVQPADDYSPLRQAYADKQYAVAHGAPPDVIALIDAHINDFTQKMRQEDVRKSVEGMGATGRFLAGAGAGLTNVWQHVKDVAHEVRMDAGPEPSYDPLRVPQGMERPTGPMGPDPAAEEAAARASRVQAQQESAPLTGTLSGELGNIAGEAAGTAPIAMATGGAGPIVGSALAGAGAGALLSEPGRRLEGAALGGASGAGIGALGRLVSAPIQGVVKPSEAAQTLQELGVPGITAGQAAPRSALAHFEQVAESTPLGAAVKSAREELPLNLEHRFIQEAAPPGFKPTLGRDELVADRLAELGSEYSRRYDALIDKGPVPKNHIQLDVLQSAMNPTGRVLAPGDIKTSSDFVASELAKLDQTNSLSTLHNIRSNVADKVRTLQRSNPELAGHLRDVKNVLTGHIEDALKASEDPEAFAKLKALDQAYSKYKTVLNSVPIDPGGPVSITPHRLSTALRGSMTPDQYARGGGGDLRVLARAGKVVTSPPRPTTGAMTGVLNALPWSGTWAVGPLGYLSSHFPQAFTGQTPVQRVLQKTLGQPVVSGALGQAARTGADDLLLGGPETPPDYEAAPLPSPSVLTQTLKRKKK